MTSKRTTASSAAAWRKALCSALDDAIDRQPDLGRQWRWLLRRLEMDVEPERCTGDVALDSRHDANIVEVGRASAKITPCSSSIALERSSPIPSRVESRRAEERSGSSEVPVAQSAQVRAPVIRGETAS